MGENIIDLDVINPEPKYVKIKGKKIDVSFVPFGCLLDIIEKIDKYDINSGETPPTRIMLEAFSDVINKLLKAGDESITDEWISQNLDGAQILKLIGELIMPLLNELNIEPGKNVKKK